MLLKRVAPPHARTGAAAAAAAPAHQGGPALVVRSGGRISVVGMFTSETFPAQLGIWWARSLDVRFAGICPVHTWWETARDAVLAGRIDPLPIVSHRLPLDDAATGYALFAAREATKVLLRP